MAFITTRDRTRLFYRDCGEGDVLVFAASASVSADMWGYNVPYLAAHGARCVAYDRRGHGRSDEPSAGYDLDTLADDLEDLLTQLELRGVTLVGHSLGGAEAIRYLARHGASGRVRRAVLVGAAAPFLVKTEDNPAGIDRAVLDATAAAWAQDFPKWVADNARPFFGPDASPEMVRWGADLMLRTPLDVVLATRRAFLGTDLRADARAVPVPTLVVHGDRDASIPVHFGRMTAALVPDCRFSLYEGAAHGLFITHAKQFNHELLRFVREVR